MATTFFTTLLKHPNYMEDLFENLQTFSFKETFADLRFVCANKQTVYAHKLLLCSVSAQLKKMISELPAGLDVVTINIPDIDVNILSIAIEFLYKGQTRVLSEHCKDFEEIMAILGIEFQFPKIVERQFVAVLPVQPTVVLPNTAPSVSHNGPIIITPTVGVPQNLNLSDQNLPTKTFLSVLPHNSLSNIQVLPIAHFFPNQPAEILISNYNENQNTVTTSHNNIVEVHPKAVVVNAEEAYKLIRKNNEPSFLDRIKHNPQVSLINVPKKSENSDSTLNTTPTNLNVTVQVCRNSNIEENRNLNNTNAQNLIVDVEDEEVQCISVDTHTKKNDNPIYIDLAGIEDASCNDVRKSVKVESVNGMCIELVDVETESEKLDTQVTSVNKNINLSTHNVKNNTNENMKNLPIDNTQPGNQTLQNRMNENFCVQQKTRKRAEKSVGFYNEDHKRMKKGSTLMEQKNSKDGNTSTTTRVENRLRRNDKTTNESTLVEQTNSKNDSQSVTNAVTVKKRKRRKFLFKNVGGLEGTMAKEARNCRGRRNSLGVSSRGRKLKPSGCYPIRHCCDDEGAGMVEATKPNSTSELTAKTASEDTFNKGNTQSEEILSTTTNKHDTRLRARRRRSFI